MKKTFDYSRAFVLALAAALPLAACGGDDDDDDPGTDVDAGPGACQATDTLPLEYRPIASVSTGELTVTAGEGVTDAVIDATAGGLTGIADNPYIYLDLEAGEKVDITDVDALDSDAWDLAFKRANIRVNGGDSGSAEVEVAVVDGTLDEVTEAPADEEFATDDWVDNNCEPIRLSDDTPASAFGEWYDYDLKTHVLTPREQVHVVRTRSGDLIKIAIATYYGDEEEPMRGAVYNVSWAPL